MSAYDESLLDAADALLGQRSRRRGKVPSAHIRRSISTSYYALFHFLIAEATIRLTGSANALRTRRNILGRAFTHRGIRSTLSKIQGTSIDPSVADFLRSSTHGRDVAAAPSFAQDVARVFADAQAKRLLADYDRNASFGASDARLLVARVRSAITGWRAASSPAERDFKHALCVLMLLRGQLRRDD